MSNATHTLAIELLLRLISARPPSHPSPRKRADRPVAGNQCLGVSRSFAFGLPKSSLPKPLARVSLFRQAGCVNGRTFADTRADSELASAPTFEQSLQRTNRGLQDLREFSNL
jgi:hypothetical protein